MPRETGAARTNVLYLLLEPTRRQIDVLRNCACQQRYVHDMPKRTCNAIHVVRAMRGGSPYMHVWIRGALSPALPHGQYPRPGYWPKRNTPDKTRTTHAGHRSQEWRVVKDTLKYKYAKGRGLLQDAPARALAKRYPRSGTGEGLQPPGVGPRQQKC